MTILLTPKAKEELDELPKATGDRIVLALREFDRTGRGDTEKISDLLWRLRVGNYRVFYGWREGKIVVVGIAHRRRSYRREYIRALIKKLSN